MRFKQLYLSEAPIAYDDETESKIGTIDPETNTKWGKTPPINIKLDQLKHWVEYAISEGILKDERLGAGMSKQCRFNDNPKTVFKYNYSLRSVGNQIKTEVSIFKKHYRNFSSVLPKFYKWGEHWVIQEYVKVVDDNIQAFQSATGIPFMVWNDSIQTLSEIQSRYDKNSRKSIKAFIEECLKADYDPTDYSAKTINAIIKNEKLFKIVEFCFKAKVDMGDMHRGNLGITTDNKIKVIDYGLRSDRNEV